VAAALGAALVPRPDQTLLLRACLRGGEPGRAAWAAWQSANADPKRALAAEHGGIKGLLPLLLHALQASRAEVSPLLLPYLRAARMHEELRSRRYREIMAEVLSILAAERVHAIVLGGAALAETVYPEPALRHCHGIDILTRPADLERSGDLLAARGFRRIHGWATGATLEHASRLRVELHTRMWELPHYRAPLDAIWARSRSQVVAGAPSRTLSPADALVRVCGHASYSSGLGSLVWACDAVLLIERSFELDWGAVMECTTESRLALPVSLMLDYLAQALDAPVPATCRDPLRAVAEASDVVSVEVALHGVRRASPDGLSALIRHARGWRARARVARWMIWPAPAYFDAIGQTHPGFLPMRYVARPGRYLIRRTREVARTVVSRVSTAASTPPPSGPCLPDGDHELALRAALLRGTSAVEAWHRLRARREPDQLNIVAWELRPLLYANLRRLGLRDPLLDAFKTAYRATWVRNERCLRHVQGLLATLGAAGIDTLVLKGGALALQYYGDLGLRPMGDIDILVPAARARDAIEALERMGWACRHSLTASFLEVKHAAPFVDADGCNCDLHWRVFEEYCPPETDAEFWDAALEFSVAGVPTRVPCPADQLLHVCVHGLKWGETPGIRWVADAVHVLRAGGVDWERFARQAVQRRFTLRAREALAYLRARLEAPIPADAAARLSRLPVSRLERLEYRLKLRPHRVLGELPLYCCNYLRSIEGRRIGRASGLLRYLQRAWDLPSIAQIPRAVLVRAVPRLTGALRRLGR
jgi:hypothetical protein